MLNGAATAGASPAGAEIGEQLQQAALHALGIYTRPDGRVDYRRLRASAEREALETAARRLPGLDLAALDARQTRLAFWINVYNALALHAIVALGLERSVWQVVGFFWRVSYRVGPWLLSLDEIEHGILRGNRRRLVPPWPPFLPGDPRRVLALPEVDPRVHFALTCGAASCPPVRLYRGSTVDVQLEAAARHFINSEVVLDAAGRIACSRLFRWYRADFGDGQALRAFLLRHLDDGPVRAALLGGAAPCQTFRPYSWTLQPPPA